MNILIIHADQHRLDCLGAYGNRQIRTPNIDRLAADGVRYDNSFCAYPVCTPSRYSLLSGLPVHEHAGWTNHSTLQADIETFCRLLRDCSWRTAAVGKMHFTPTYLDVGFERMLLAEQDGPGRWDDDYHRELMRRGLADRLDLTDQRREYRGGAGGEYWRTFGATPSDLPEPHHSTTWIGDRAVELLGQWAGERDLLMVGFIKPHHPFDPPAAWARMYDGERIDPLDGWTEQCFAHDLAMSEGYFPHVGLTEPALRRVTAHYYAAISHIDDQVGRMIQVLSDRGLYDDTLIVYTSDHGDYMGFHHLLLKGGYMYDPLVKVPLIVKWPGSARASTSTAALVSNVDVAPTLLARAGCPRGRRMAGLDLFDQPAGREMVFAESGRGRQLMARSASYKLLLGGGDRANLFFDLQADPLEQVNLYDAPEHQSTIRRFAAAAEEWQGGELSETYLDEDAPIIAGANVPPPDRSHREEIIAYYRRKMAEADGSGRRARSIP